MTEHLNDYGDKFTPTDDGHGVDIASQRQDELDLQSLDFVKKQLAASQKIRAVDLGGGFGAHSIRLAEAGAQVTMIDLADMASENFSKTIHEKRVPPGNLKFVQKDFSALSEEDIPDGTDLVYSQRAIHYILYGEAKKLLSHIFSRMVKGGMIFISAAGYDTEYGKTYPDRDKPVAERFNFVAFDMQAKHGITHKIVTYTQQEMKTLLESAGFSEIKVSQSTFGNIKAIAKKPESL